ncbi:hypothetical protein [Bacillus wiedmannii]|uniref:hypothetical protein n=1 Tax=Bacillus cereus group TaxID=86661 RepID=UPI0021D3589D|nr:hypothetical protein [Bacillus wiedmannii]MCU5681281.1 hypothetical protein [Bacillus wiedmannii]
MWEDLSTIKNLLMNKRYNQALKIIKRSIHRSIENEQQEEVIIILRKEMLFLNMSGDSHQTSLFCDKLMQYCLDSGLNIKEYVEQCKVLNKELDWYGEQYRLILKEFHTLDPHTTLHSFLSTFENSNHLLLSEEPDELQQAFYFSYVYGKETNYESSISSLNRLLKLWLNSYQNNLFQGKFDLSKFLSKSIDDLCKKLAPTIGSLNYLEWLCKQISIQETSMKVTDSEVSFTIENKEEYLSYKLPFIRDTARMQYLIRTFPEIQRLFTWDHKQIDYNKIVDIKKSGDDFRLKIDPAILFEALKHSLEVAYQNSLLIQEDMYIFNLNKLKVKINSATLSVSEAFFFYHCLRTMALLYFEATGFFIETQKKSPRFPYLSIDKNDIWDMFSTILSTYFKRKLEKNEFDRLIALFTFGNNNIFDLFYKPLIVMGETVVIYPSIFLMNNFSKTFPHHMNALNVNLADRGDDFEKIIQKLFIKHKFTVHQKKFPYAYRYNNTTITGDIDLIAQKGKYLYIGQLKNRLEPQEPKDYRGADKKIKVGIEQTKQSLLYIKRNPDEFCSILGIERKELDNLQIQPFVLVSCYYGSGKTIQDTPIIDASSLIRFLDEGEIRVFPPQGEPYSRKLRTSGDIIPEEFNHFLKDPYFLHEYIYGMQLAIQHGYKVGNRVFILSTKDDWHKQFKNNFVTEAIKHFENEGTINFN